MRVTTSIGEYINEAVATFKGYTIRHQSCYRSFRTVRMCKYIEYTVMYRECTQKPKHIIRREKDVYCDRVTVNGKPICKPVERVPWEFGSSRVVGTCPECGKYLCHQNNIRHLTQCSFLGTWNRLKLHSSMGDPVEDMHSKDDGEGDCEDGF